MIIGHPPPDCAQRMNRIRCWIYGTCRLLVQHHFVLYCGEVSMVVYAIENMDRSRWPPKGKSGALAHLSSRTGPARRTDFPDVGENC